MCELFDVAEEFIEASESEENLGPAIGASALSVVIMAGGLARCGWVGRGSGVGVKFQAGNSEVRSRR